MRGLGSNSGASPRGCAGSSSPSRDGRQWGGFLGPRLSIIRSVSCLQINRHKTALLSQTMLTVECLRGFAYESPA